MICCGQPKREIHPATSVFATISAMMSGMGKASGQWVNLSTAVKQLLNPEETGSGPIRSIWTCRKHLGGKGNSAGGVLMWRQILDRWHCWHVRAQRRQSLWIPGHTKCCETNLVEALTPGWLRLWRDMKTCLLNGEVMNGRGLSEDVSQDSSLVVPGMGTFCSRNAVSDWTNWHSSSLCC